MRKNKKIKSKASNSCKASRRCKNNSKKITGFEDSKSFELDKDSDNSFELK